MRGWSRRAGLLVAVLLGAGAHAARPPAQEEEALPELAAELPALALEEVPAAWRDSPRMAEEMVQRLSLELRADSLPGIEEGPRALDALAEVVGDPRAQPTDVEDALQSANAALAVHHARQSAAQALRERPAHAATQLRVAAAHLERAAQARGATAGVADELAGAQEVANAALSGAPDTAALDEEAQAIARAGRALGRTER